MIIREEREVKLIVSSPFSNLFTLHNAETKPIIKVLVKVIMGKLMVSKVAKQRSIAKSELAQHCPSSERNGSRAVCFTFRPNVIATIKKTNSAVMPIIPVSIRDKRYWLSKKKYRPGSNVFMPRPNKGLARINSAAFV